MDLINPELCFDFRPTFVPKTISGFLEDVSTIRNVSDRISKFNELVKRLEAEKRKIHAFKRELPLCMLLLNDAILALKEKSSQLTGSDGQPLLELFLNTEYDKNEEKEKENDCEDKKKWMSSVQLWISDNCPTSKCETKRNGEESHSATKGSSQSSNERKVPLKTYTSFLADMPVREDEKEQLTLKKLSIWSRGIKASKEESNLDGTRLSCSKEIAPAAANFSYSSQTGQQQTCSKQRRCWSPELHRRFVNALQQIGGSQVATPKQIRDLMQVDGLTNDEVKSHLNTAFIAAKSQHPLHELLCEFLRGSISRSGSPQGPLQLSGNGGTSTTADDSTEDDAESEGLS